MTQEKQKLRRIVFPESRNVHGKPIKSIPAHSVGRPFLKDLELTFIPDLEVVEVVSSSHPTLLIPRDQVFSMEPEQDKVHPSEVPAPEPVPTAVVKPPEGARSNLDAPLLPPVEPVKTATAWTTSPDGGGSGPDLRPPPKVLRDSGMVIEQGGKEVTVLVEGDPIKPKESRFGKIGKRKSGRSRKGSKS